MLETIKQTIKDLPSITFEEYFISYVMQVQDSSINTEMNFVLRNNFLTPVDIDKLVNQEVTSYDKLLRNT